MQGLWFLKEDFELNGSRGSLVLVLKSQLCYYRACNAASLDIEIEEAEV